MAFPNAEGESRLQEGHFCDPAKAATASELVHGVLHDKIPTLIKQRVNSRTGNNNHLVALRLPSPREEIIKLRNPGNLSKPGIVFRYSERLEPAKENKNKCDYLTRAIGTTPLSIEELTDFLEHMRNATLAIVTVHNNNTHEDDLSQDSLSYFVYIN